MMHNRKSILITIFLFPIWNACNPYCNAPLHDSQAVCIEPDLQSDTLWLATFDKKNEPSLYCGSVGTWSEPPGRVSVSISFEEKISAQKEKDFCLKLEIRDNQLLPQDSMDWLGGGMVCRFSGDSSGLDMSFHDYLEFDVKIAPGSNLDELLIKLEDISAHATPERRLKDFGTISNTWTHYSIPLELLSEREWFDPDSVVSVNRNAVVSLTTVSFHSGTQPLPTDGILYLDNLYLSRR